MFFLVLIFGIFLINVYKPIKMLHNTERVEQITIYDIDSERSVIISEKDKVEIYVTEIKNLEFKRTRPVGNSSATGVLTIFKDADGNTIDTLYTSEKELIYHHWLVNIRNGTNPYEMVMSKLNK